MCRLLPTAVLAHIYTFLRVDERGAIAETCGHLRTVSRLPAASPVKVDLPRPGDVTAFALPIGWRPVEIAIYNHYGLCYLKPAQLCSLVRDNPRLQRLHLSHVYFPASALSSLPSDHALPALRQLSLFGPPDDVCARLLGCAAATLEYLRIRSVRGAGYMLRGERALSAASFLAALVRLSRLDTLALEQVGEDAEDAERAAWFPSVRLPQLARLELVHVRPAGVVTALVAGNATTLRQLVLVSDAGEAPKRARVDIVRAISECALLHTFAGPEWLPFVDLPRSDTLVRLALPTLAEMRAPLLREFPRLAHVACTASSVPLREAVEQATSPESSVRVLEFRDGRNSSRFPEHGAVLARRLAALFPATEHVVLVGACHLAAKSDLCRRLTRLRRVTIRSLQDQPRFCARIATVCLHVQIECAAPAVGVGLDTHWPDPMTAYFENVAPASPSPSDPTARS